MRIPKSFQVAKPEIQAGLAKAVMQQFFNFQLGFLVPRSGPALYTQELWDSSFEPQLCAVFLLWTE